MCDVSAQFGRDSCPTTVATLDWFRYFAYRAAFFFANTPKVFA